MRSTSEIFAMAETDDEFFDVSIDMLCCLGFDGRFQRLNPAWERTLGFTRERVDVAPIHRVRSS
jgi:PAS domain-containing protein